MEEEKKSITDKPLVGIIVSAVIAAAVIFGAVYVAGRGWKQGTKAA